MAENRYGGMTANERLYFSGLMDKYDTAIERKNTAEVIAILKEVELSEENIHAVLHHLKLME